MKGDKIYYKDGYRYQLTRDYTVFTGIMLPETVAYEFFTLTADGYCKVRHGFSWDGASGPTFDSKSSMRPSLIHDCYCQAAKDGRINYKTFAPEYNRVFKEMCIEDGMWGLRASIWKAGVIIGRGGDPAIPDEVIEQEAP